MGVLLSFLFKDTRGREQVIHIPLRVVKANWNLAVSRNNHEKGYPVSVLVRAR